MNTPQLCAFDGRRFNVRCERPRVHENFCIFHHRTDPPWASQENYQNALQGLINQGDGNWVGFRFPFNIGISGMTLGFPVDGRGMQTKGLSFANCTFSGPANFWGARFDGDVIFEEGELGGDTHFTDATVNGRFDWTIAAKGLVSFNNVHFKGSASFRAEFDSTVIFSAAAFHESVEFVGGWDPTVNVGGTPLLGMRSRYVFNGEVRFDRVDFRRPSRSSFRMVDLRKAGVIDVDFRGVSFQDVKWDQPNLGRRGIHDEVWARESNVLRQMLPRLETAYRNLRAAHEDSKDFQSATDFYVGELEARRLQRPVLGRVFGIEATYKLLSKYGSSPIRAVSWLVIFVILHMGATTAIQSTECVRAPMSCNVDAETVVHSAQLLTILRGPTFTMLRGGWGLVDVVFQILVVVQLALLVFALRARIRRG